MTTRILIIFCCVMCVVKFASTKRWRENQSSNLIREIQIQPLNVHGYNDEQDLPRKKRNIEIIRSQVVELGVMDSQAMDEPSYDTDTYNDRSEYRWNHDTSLPLYEKHDHNPPPPSHDRNDHNQPPPSIDKNDKDLPLPPHHRNDHDIPPVSFDITDHYSLTPGLPSSNEPNHYNASAHTSPHSLNGNHTELSATLNDENSHDVPPHDRDNHYPPPPPPPRHWDHPRPPGRDEQLPLPPHDAYRDYPPPPPPPHHWDHPHPPDRDDHHPPPPHDAYRHYPPPPPTHHHPPSLRDEYRHYPPPPFSHDRYPHHPPPPPPPYSYDRYPHHPPPPPHGFHHHPPPPPYDRYPHHPPPPPPHEFHHHHPPPPPHERYNHYHPPPPYSEENSPPEKAGDASNKPTVINLLPSTDGENLIDIRSAIPHSSDNEDDESDTHNPLNKNDYIRNRTFLQQYAKYLFQALPVIPEQ